MKKSNLLIAGLCMVLSFTAFSPAKAATTTQTTTQNSGLLGGLGDWLNGLFGGGSGSGSGSTGGSTSGSSNSGTSGSPAGTALPINGGVWFLVVAGGFVGYKVISSKSKAVKA